MKIGFEAQRILRKHKHGMDFVAIELLQAIKRSNWAGEVVIFCNAGEQVPEEWKDERFTWEIWGAPYPIWEQFDLPKRAKKHGVDVLHCTSNTAPLWHQLPLVVTLHDIIYLEKHPLFAKGYTPYQRFGNLYRRWNVKRMVKKAAKLITVSHFEKENIYRRFPGLASNAVQVIYNAAGPHFRPVNDPGTLSAIKNQYHLPEEFVLFLGNTDPKKNTARVLQTYAQWKNSNASVPPLVVGDLKPEFVQQCLRTVDLERQAANIHLTGYIANKDLPAIMSQAEFFLYPSLRESFGIPLLEAMGCGTPTITSRTSSMPEVGGEAAVYVDPYSSSDLFRAMNELYNQPAERKALKEKGLQRAAAFSWDHSAQELITLYQTLLQ